MEFNGYHGTSNVNAKRIMAGDFNTATRLGWLGVGTYFFELNPNIAIAFAKKRHNTFSVTIIECRIVVDKDLVLDLTDPASLGSKEFHKERNDFIEAFGSAKISVISKNERDFDQRVVERLCCKKRYELVRAHTYTYSDMDRSLSLRSNIPNGTEICLRNKSRIVEKRIFPLEYII